MNEKLKWLMTIYEVQTKASAQMMEAELAKSSGDWVEADRVFRNYISTLKEWLKRSLEHNELFPESPFEIYPVANMLKNALLTGADVRQAVGGREEAEALRRGAIDISSAHLGTAGQADAERSRASALILEGRFNEAIVALMNARDDIVAVGDILDIVRVTIDLADVFQWLGDYGRARDEIARAELMIEPFVEGGPPGMQDVLSGLMSDFSSIMAGKGDPGGANRKMALYRASLEVTYYHGLVAKALGEWDEAELCMEKILSDYEKQGVEAAIEFQLAMVKLGRGLHADALRQFEKIEPEFETGAFRAKKAGLLLGKAKCLHGLGESARAKMLLDESIHELTELHYDPDLLWNTQWLDATVSSDAGDVEQGLLALRSCIGTVDGLRRAPLGYRLDSAFLSDKIEVYAHAVAQTLESGDLVSCCAYMDGIKSRTLSAVLSVPRPDADASDPQADLFEKITSQLDSLEFKGYRDGWTSEVQRQRAQLLADRADLLERIRIADPRWRLLTESPEFDHDRLLTALRKRRQAALSLFMHGDEIFCVLLANGRLAGGVLGVSSDTRNGLENYARNLQMHSPDVFEHDLSQEFGIGAEDLIPPSLLAEALETDSLVVVPHGILHLVPWSGLLHGKRRLFEYLPVGVLPNLSLMLQEDRSNEPSSVAMFGVGDYGGVSGLSDLESTPGEMSAIAAIYGASRVSARLLDAEATEQAFWNYVGSVDGERTVLHMSCHGVIVPAEPMNSGLVLYDSKVDAAEIARSGMNFKEVVLSACSTGWRPTEVRDVVLASDEILSIPAGFLEMGAQSVLVSIPKAEGRTASELVSVYHRKRLSGDSPLFAYRNAQMHMLEKEIGKPALWIGFVLYGCQ